MQAARAASRRARAGIPDYVRHTEKWRLALEMLGEMTGPEGWGVLDQIAARGNARPVVAKIRWRIEHDYRELKAGLGLDHFEVRSFTGWHRHVTLAALAQAFCTPLRTDRKVPAPG